jgi:integrase
VSKCPDVELCDVFYLHPLQKPTESHWYSAQLLGRHKLANVVSDLWKQGGLHGLGTKHSLRASGATRLDHEGVDEPLISEVTGHRSNVIWNYKRTTATQKGDISEILQGHKDSDTDDDNNNFSKE